LLYPAIATITDNDDDDDDDDEVICMESWSRCGGTSSFAVNQPVVHTVTAAQQTSRNCHSINIISASEAWLGHLSFCIDRV